MAPGQDNDSGMESGSQEGSEQGSAGAEPQENQEGSQKDTEGSVRDEESQEAGSKGSQEEKTSSDDKESKDKGEYDDEPDESLSERLWGLTEMFPEGVRNTASTVYDHTIYGVKGLYSFSRTAFWVVFSSSIILFAPVMFEVERAQLEEMQRSQQKQMLLGPTSTVHGNKTGVPLLPPLER